MFFYCRLAGVMGLQNHLASCYVDYSLEHEMRYNLRQFSIKEQLNMAILASI
jgi:hypothetical protein